MKNQTKTKKEKKMNAVDLWLARFGVEEEKEYFLENLASSFLIEKTINMSHIVFTD